MSLVSVAEVQARNVGAELSDSALQDVIDAAEAYLARHIGTLSGERTETFYPRRGYEALYLRRSTDSVVVENNGDTLTAGDSVGNFRLLYSGSVVELVSGDWISGTDIGPVSVTYTPNDEALVKEAVVGLVRLNLSDGPFVSERIGDYSYQKAQGGGSSLEPARNEIVKSILPRRPFRSERLVSASHP